MQIIQPIPLLGSIMSLKGFVTSPVYIQDVVAQLDWLDLITSNYDLLIYSRHGHEDRDMWDGFPL